MKERLVNNKILIFSILSLGFGLFKNAYIDIYSDTFTTDFLLPQGVYSIERLLFWLLPVVTVSFMVCKSTHIRIHYFNVRYHNRKQYIKNCLFKLFMETVVYTTLNIFLQLLIITILRKYWVNLDITVVIKFLLDMMVMNLFIVLFDLIGKEFIYIFVVIHCLLVVQLLFFLNPIFPLVRISVMGSNLLICIELVLAVLFIYKIYIRKDIY